MAELLGQAVLELKTDDAAFVAGVNKAEAAANGLGKTLDACSGSSVKLAADITEAANAGNRGAQAWLTAGTAIERLAAAQVEADTEIRNAKAALDGGTISLEQYKRQVLETQSALAIYEEEHRKAQTELRRTIAANKEVTAATGAQRQGLIQLTQQLGDATTMYSLGMRPAQIFASQIGQTAGAVQLLAGEGSAFARFLGGPWGVALTGAVVVLGPLIGSLIQTQTEMQKVELASNGLGDAQGVLGQMFDLTTGKIKAQTEALRANAQEQALMLRVEASKREESSRAVLGSAERGEFSKLSAIGMGLRFASNSEVEQVQNRINTLQGWVRQYRAGSLTGSEVLKLSESMSFDGLPTNRQQFQQAILDDFSAKGKRETADAIERSLWSGKLDPMFLQPGSKTRKNKSGKSQAEIDAEFLQAIDGLNRDELQARLALATDAGDRLEIQKQLLDNDREAKLAAIEADKNFSVAQKEAMKAYIDRLYGRPGKVGPDGQIIAEGRPGLLGQAASRAFEQEQTRLANDMLQRQAETAQAWGQVTRSATARAAFEAEALKLQQQIQTNLLEQQIATGQVADAEKARAELRSQQEAVRRGLADRTAGPLAQYADQLAANKEDSGRRVEALMVQELDYVHRSITDSISSRLGVEDPFLKGLIDMFIEDVFIRPMAESLRNASGGGGGGIFSSLFGSLFGGGASPQASLAGDVASTISDPQFAGLFAGGGLIPDGAWGIVGDAGPEPIRATAGGIEVLPNSSLRAMGGARAMPGTLKVEISGARGNAEIEAMVRSGVAQGLAAYDQGVAGRVREQSDRRS